MQLSGNVEPTFLEQFDCLKNIFHRRLSLAAAEEAIYVSRLKPELNVQLQHSI